MDSFKMLKRRATDLLNSVPQSLPSMDSLHIGHHGHGHKGGAPTMKGTWEKISGLPELPRSSHSVNIVGGTIYIFGGDPDDNDMHAVTLPSSGASADCYAIKAKAVATEKPIPTIVTPEESVSTTVATEKPAPTPAPTPAKPQATPEDDDDDDDDDDDEDDSDDSDEDDDSDDSDDSDEAEPATTTPPTTTALPPTTKPPTPTVTNVPSPRLGHATATIGHRIFLFGGRRTTDPSSALDEAGRVWVFDTRSHTWSYLDPVSPTVTSKPAVPSPRSDHTAVATDKPNEFNQAPAHPKPLTRTATWKDWALGTDDVAEFGTPQRPIVGNVAERAVDPDQSGFGTLIIHGGLTATGVPTSETWAFDVHSRNWQRLPDAPGAPRAAAALALSHSRLYRFGGLNADGRPEGGQLDFLDLGVDSFDDEYSAGEVVVTARGAWQSLLANREDVGYKEPDQAAAPVLAPEPWPGKRSAARMEAVTVGGGRQYLVLMMGKGDGFWDDVWTFQVPGQGGLADSFMEAVGRGRGGGWVRVEVGPEDDEDDESIDGPGGRAWMGSVTMGDLEESGIVIWGGEGPGVKRLGDGWIFRLK